MISLFSNNDAFSIINWFIAMNAQHVMLIVIVIFTIWFSFIFVILKTIKFLTTFSATKTIFMIFFAQCLCDFIIDDIRTNIAMRKCSFEIRLTICKTIFSLNGIFLFKCFITNYTTKASSMINSVKSDD